VTCSHKCHKFSRTVLPRTNNHFSFEDDYSTTIDEKAFSKSVLKYVSFFLSTIVRYECIFNLNLPTTAFRPSKVFVTSKSTQKQKTSFTIIINDCCDEILRDQPSNRQSNNKQQRNSFSFIIIIII
jgi:hypothetical protein